MFIYCHSVQYTGIVTSRCEQNWQPHDGQPLLCIFFLDDLKHQTCESVPIVFIIYFRHHGAYALSKLFVLYLVSYIILSFTALMLVVGQLES